MTSISERYSACIFLQDIRYSFFVDGVVLYGCVTTYGILYGFYLFFKVEPFWIFVFSPFLRYTTYMKNPINQETFLQILDDLYKKSIEWDKHFDSAEVLARWYTSKTRDKHDAAKRLIRSEITKTSSSGFVASLGGLITIPLTVPADMYVTFLVQIRMILAIAYIGGKDLYDPDMKTVVLSILLGTEVQDIFIKVGMKPTAKKITFSFVKKVPAKVLLAVNKKIWIRLFSIFGSKWLISVGLAVPLVGWLVGGGINYYFTRRIARNSIEVFIDETVEESSKM